MRHECKDPDECWFWWLGTWIATGIQPPQLAPEIIRNELYDYHTVLSGLAEMYDEITGGLISKPNTDKIHIIQAVEERIQQAHEQSFKEGLETGLAGGFADE